MRRNILSLTLGRLTRCVPVVLFTVALAVFLMPETAFAQTSDWINYTSGAQVTALVDDGNYLWVGRYGGLTRLNKTTGDMVYYNSANSQLPDNMISSIAKDVNEDLWIGTDNGLAKFDGTNWTVYDSDDFQLWRSDITCLAIDEEGNKWIGVFDEGLVKFDGTNWTVYNTENSGLPENDFREIVIDTEGNKWLGTNGGGLAKFDGTNWTVYDPDNSEMPGISVSSIAFDANGDLWLGFGGWNYPNGLAKFDGTNWTIYNEDNSPLPSNTVRCIAVDTDGNKWIGTYKGFAKFDGTNWTVYDTDHLGLLANDVYSVAIDTDGNKWIGFYGGLVKFDGTNWTVYNTGNSGLPDNYVQSLAFDVEGDTWVGTWFGGLSRFDGTDWTVYLEGIPDRHVSDIAIDGEGNKWIVTWNGLAKFDGTNWTIYNKDNSGLPGGGITCLTIDAEGNKWMGVYDYATGSGGLAKFDGTNWTIYNKDNSGLPVNGVSSIAIDAGGNKWIGTGGWWFGEGGGLVKFDGSNWTVYNEENSGLPNNRIVCLAIDGEGNKWIGAGGQVARFDGTNWTIYDRYTSQIVVDVSGNIWMISDGITKFDGRDWTVYNASNSGLPNRRVECLVTDVEGHIWVGTWGGVGVYLAPSAVQVSIPDLNLKAAIRDAIDKLAGPITEEDLQEITSLDASERSISDLTGIEHCIDLQWLRLWDNLISDIAPLSGLTNLQELRLARNYQINDISPLSNLTSLRELDLRNSQVSDLSPLSSLTNLELLDLGGNRISDLSPLSSLTNLEMLSLWGNQISDLGPLNSLTKLQRLWLNSNQITDISPLSSMTNLKMLHAGDNPIAHFTPLSGLPRLEDLGLWSNQITDITFLSSLTNMQFLMLHYNQIIDISPLSSLTNLQSLMLHSNQISDISSLVANTGINSGDEVNLRDNPLNVDAYTTYIPALVARGVNLSLDRIFVYLPALSVCPGRTILIPVHVSDVTGQSIHSTQTTISYDSDVVRMLEATAEGALTQNWAIDYAISRSLESTIDTIRIALATPFTDTLSGSGPIVLLRAMVPSAASIGDSTSLTFEHFQFNEGTPDADTQDGSVTVVSLLGDVSGNGDVSAYDAALILTEVVGMISLPDPEWPNFTLRVADVSGNGESSAYDAALVLRYVVGLLYRFPAEGVGGVSRPVYVERTISMGGMERRGDGRVAIPLVIDEMEGVISGELDLLWEGAVAPEIRTTDLTSDYLSASNVQENRIRFSFASAQSSIGEGTIAEIIFSSAPEALSIDRVRLNEGMIPVRALKTPTVYRLSQNYPNPFNPETTITYDVAKTGVVRLTVYGLTGQLVRTLVEEERSAGSYSVLWDGRDGAGRDVASGVYLCRMEAGEYGAVRKLLLMK